MARHLQQPVRRAVPASNGSLAAVLTLSFNIGDVLFFTSQVAWALYSIIIVVRIIDDVSPCHRRLVGSVRFAYHGSRRCLFSPFRTALAAFAAGCSLISVRHFCRGLIAMIFWNKGTGIVGPSQAAVFMNIMPLVGIISAYCFLMNAFSPHKP